MKEIKCLKTAANWSISLHVDCPNCEEYFDILCEYYEQEMWGDVQVGESKELSQDFEVTCPKCKEEIKITETTF